MTQTAQQESTSQVPRINESLSTVIGVPEEEIYALIKNKKNEYRQFTLECGRKILSPSIRLKKVQKKIAKFLTLICKPHYASHAYTHGRDVHTAAAPHVAAKTVVKMDIHKFFPSINCDMIHVYLMFAETKDRMRHHSSTLSGSTVLQIMQLCTLDNSLPIGSPCSPILSEIVMNNFDNQMVRLARFNKFMYTRYADDIIISGNKPHHAINKIYKLMLNYGFKPNVKKTKVMHSKGCQKVFGLILNDLPGKGKSRIGADQTDLRSKFRVVANQSMIAIQKNNKNLLKSVVEASLHVSEDAKKKKELPKQLDFRVSMALHDTMMKDDILGCSNGNLELDRMPAARASRKYRRQLRAMHHQLKLQERNAPKGEGLLDYKEQDVNVIKGKAAWVRQSPRSLANSSFALEKKIAKEK